MQYLSLVQHKRGHLAHVKYTKRRETYNAVWYTIGDDSYRIVCIKGDYRIVPMLLLLSDFKMITVCRTLHNIDDRFGRLHNIDDRIHVNKFTKLITVSGHCTILMTISRTLHDIGVSIQDIAQH